MSLDLNTFKTNLGVAARPNNFYVTMSVPTLAAGSLGRGSVANIRYLAKATTIPSFTMGIVEIPHIGGRRLKVPGDRIFNEWQVTFIADETMGVHKLMEQWTNYIKRYDFDNDDLTGGDNDTDYYGTVTVTHTDVSGKDLRSYQLDQAFPTEVAQLDMSYDNFDQIAEFSVTFQYSGITTKNLQLYNSNYYAI